MDINPNNLGKPLYDEDQVITQQDLEGFINQLDILFETVALSEEEAQSFDAVMETLIALQDWLRYNKLERDKILGRRTRWKLLRGGRV
jgi:hypothetical protein